MQLNVEQACSGMRMLVAFFALAVALAYSTARPTWQKLTLAACALPIAVICNGFRVTMTGVLAVRVDEAWAVSRFSRSPMVVCASDGAARPSWR